MDYGENNKIISLYSRHGGKLSVMVRGAKKMSSRLAAVTQLFTYGDYVIYKTGSMGSLNQGEPLKSHQKLRENLHYSAYSAYLVELFDRIMPEEESDESMFEQLLSSLDAIEAGKDPEIIMHIMEMKMLAIAGYLPQLDECVSCGKQPSEMVPGDPMLSIHHGGILCPQCAFKDPQKMPLTTATLKILRLFQHMDLRKLGNIELKALTKMQLKQSMRSLMDTYIEVRLKSRRFLDQMEKYEI